MTDEPDVKLQNPKTPDAKPNDGHEETGPGTRTEVHFPPAVVEEYRARQGKKEGNEKRRFIVEVFTLFVISLYTAIAGYQGCKMREATRATQQSADAAAKAATTAEKSFNASISSSRLDQRAWLGIGESKVVQFEKDKSFKYEIHLKNTGKTPALQIQQAVQYRSDLRTNAGKLDEWFKSIKYIDVQSIPPGAVYTYHGSITWDEFTKAFESINSGEQVLYIFGGYKYMNIFNELCHTEFCLKFDLRRTEKPSLFFCGSHNNMN